MHELSCSEKKTSKMMMMKENKTENDINVNIGNAVFTKQVAAKVCMALVEFLLINKNQIPFPVVSFQQIINRINNVEHDENSDVKKPNLVGKYKAERKRNKAMETYNMYNQLNEIMISTFEKCDIHQAIILFGQTKFTTKECFVINFPESDVVHSSVTVSTNQSEIVRKIIMSILGSADFFNKHGNILRQTNMHLLLKLKDGSSAPCMTNFQIQNYLRLPHKCRTTHFNIQNNTEKLDSKPFNIFSDIDNTGNAAEPCSDSNIFFECNVILKGIKWNQ
ncbi:uncharacterized protein LOC116347065 [Contarinia nasturtii]|uniref:uncharacterized protein LOC116347065 n=1 Tax=Contarinia nasturtii TaxID=265458 RepID=UPI0012D39CB2|nr:uncharacterized protein LOC116347065 [Contarinia nasturtii]